MGWLKDLFEGLSMPDYNKMLTDRLAKEQRERDEIFDMSKNQEKIKEFRDNHAIEYRIAQKKELEQQVEEERAEEEKATNSLKLVIDGAKLQCDLCTNPIGDLKVNYRTPSIQDKKTATVVEKDMRSLIFKGNCKKSPQSHSPCASVMQLADWKNVGNVKIQEQFPLLLKSTIKCIYGGIDIKIIDCAQRSEPTDIDGIFPEKKQILSIKWMCAEMEENIKDCGDDEKVSLLVKTKHYKEGETITIIVDDENGYDAKAGEKEITLTGIVGSDGYAKLKEAIEITKVADKPKHKSVAQLAREEAEKTEIYISRNGKDYTHAEWKQFQNDWHDEMERKKEMKKEMKKK